MSSVLKPEVLKGGLGSESRGIVPETILKAFQGKEEPQMSAQELKEKAEAAFKDGHFKDSHELYTKLRAAEGITGAIKGLATRRIKTCEEKLAEAQARIAEAKATVEAVAPTSKVVVGELEPPTMNEVESTITTHVVKAPAAATQGSGTKLFRVPEELEKVMQDNGLGDMLDIPAEAKPDEAVEALFSIAFRKVSELMLKASTADELEYAAAEAALRAPLKVMVRKFPGQLRKKLQGVVKDESMGLRKLNVIVRQLNEKLGFPFDFDRTAYKKALHEKIKEGQERAVVSSNQSDIQAMIQLSYRIEEQRKAALNAPPKTPQQLIHEELLRFLNEEPSDKNQE